MLTKKFLCYSLLSCGKRWEISLVYPLNDTEKDYASFRKNSLQRNTSFDIWFRFINLPFCNIPYGWKNRDLYFSPMGRFLHWEHSLFRTSLRKHFCGGVTDIVLRMVPRKNKLPYHRDIIGRNISPMGIYPLSRFPYPLINKILLQDIF